MLYTWSFSHNTEVPRAINNNKYFLLLITNTTVFAWGAGNSPKTLNNQIHQYGKTEIKIV